MINPLEHVYDEPLSTTKPTNTARAMCPWGNHRTSLDPSSPGTGVGPTETSSSGMGTRPGIGPPDVVGLYTASTRRHSRVPGKCRYAWLRSGAGSVASRLHMTTSGWSSLTGSHALSTPSRLKPQRRATRCEGSFSRWVTS